MINRKRISDKIDEAALSGSTLLSLSLFVILLAFFIVLNSISTYSDPKIDAAFDSLDLAFDKNIIQSEFQEQVSDETQTLEAGKGDSIEDMHGILRSILPGLDTQLSENPNGGKIMAIRIKKDQFERLSSRLIPLFVRIMNVKDGENDFELSITSYVQNVLNASARQSFKVIESYQSKIVDGGIAPKRLNLSVEQGNPAYMMFRFDAVGGRA